MARNQADHARSQSQESFMRPGQSLNVNSKAMETLASGISVRQSSDTFRGRFAHARCAALGEQASSPDRTTSVDALWSRIRDWHRRLKVLVKGDRDHHGLQGLRQ